MKRLLLLVALTAGCEMSPDRASKSGIGGLCYAVAVSRAGNSSPESGANALVELVRRGAITEAEAKTISRNGPTIGMREDVAVCAWGGLYDHVNTTQTASGIRKQFVFAAGRYLYTTNGRLTAIQQ